MSILVGMTPLAILNDVYRIILMFFVVVVVDFFVFFSEGFSIPDFIHYIYFPILILEKEPVFSL